MIGTIIAALFVGMIEVRLRQSGHPPTINDSKELWATQRAYATLLGGDGLILLGSSRIQLGVDLEELSATTGLTPVQLAIDGSQFLPVLESLALDPTITGTVLVSATLAKLTPSSQRDRADEWAAFYAREYQGRWSPAVEAKIRSIMQGHSAIYASGLPIHLILRHTLLRGERYSAPYLTTRATRERDADYSLVQQPHFYIARVLRHLGEEVDLRGITTMEEFNGLVRRKIAQLPPHPGSTAKQFSYINALIDKIIHRGGRVIFVRFPTSKLVWEIDQKRMPRTLGWDVFAGSTNAATLHFMDYPELQPPLPDGSHIDARNKKVFTRALAHAIHAIPSLPSASPTHND